MSQLNKTQIHELFAAINNEMSRLNLSGELNLVGGAVMCLVFDAREATQDVDAFFAPTTSLREAAKRVAFDRNLDPHWLNDGVKGFLSPQGDFSDYLELSHLRVMTATAEYMLAMKCLATRIGDEFHDIDDIRYLLKHMGIETVSKAYEIIANYYPLDKFPLKSKYILEELLENDT
ncbi:MAG: hypothetical protein V4534_08805 [Myxococcota bacterium]